MSYLANSEPVAERRLPMTGSHEEHKPLLYFPKKPIKSILNNTVVKPAKISNHLAGFAIDINIMVICTMVII